MVILNWVLNDHLHNIGKWIKESLIDISQVCFTAKSDFECFKLQTYSEETHKQLKT